MDGYTRLNLRGATGLRMALIWLAALLLFVAGCRMPHEPTPIEPGDPVAEDEPEAAAGQPDGEAALAIADVGGVERDGRLKFVVSLSVGGGGGAPVTVVYATEDGTATAGRDYVTANGTLTFAGAAAETREIEVLVRDDAVAEAQETFTMRLSEAQGAKLSVAAATGTIVDDDTRSVAVYPAALNVGEGAAESYTVVLGSRPTAPVTVTVAAPEELSAAPDEVVFTAADWRRARTVTVTAEEDEDALADAPVELTQVASGGGYDGVAVAAVTVTIVENDVTTLAVGAASAEEAAGRIRFEVSLSLANDNVVTVEYATGAPGDTARAGADYTPASGMLSFPVGTTAARLIEVVVHDDRLDEAAEEFTVTLSNPVHAVLAGGGDRATATGTIEDDDEAPKLTIADGSASESDADMTFTVALDGASGRLVTVRYATADGTAVSGTDYTAASGTLTFGGGATTGTIEVPIVADQVVEDPETFTVTLRDPLGATLTDATASGTIDDDDDSVLPPIELGPLELSALEVTGGGTMYPAFDPGTRHYAVRCEAMTTLQVDAQALQSSTQLTLLRNNPADNHVATGSLSTDVIAGSDHDLVIELGRDGTTETYVVHCNRAEFSKFTVLLKTDGATEGLLFMKVDGDPAGVLTHRVIVDYNGVIRYHSQSEGSAGRNFRPHGDGPVIDGKRVRYSVILGSGVMLLDADFHLIRRVGPVSFPTLDDHDFVLGPDSFLFISYVPRLRDYTPWGGGSSVQVWDSVISEIAFAGSDAGAERYQWNSWDHLKIAPDCAVGSSTREYAHLNSLQFVEGDIIASFRGCAQVVRIDRTPDDNDNNNDNNDDNDEDETWPIQWKLGGTAPPRSTGTEHLEIVGDPLGEFCGQHHATLTDKDHVLLFDNGAPCLGQRKEQERVTRVVEYDISSATQASFVREYERPDGHGYSDSHGGATLLDNGNWLIAWGTTEGSTLATSEVAMVTEVDTGGNAVFHLNVTDGSGTGWLAQYRVYHDSEANVTIPLKLP